MVAIQQLAASLSTSGEPVSEPLMRLSRVLSGATSRSAGVEARSSESRQHCRECRYVFASVRPTLLRVRRSRSDGPVTDAVGAECAHVVAIRAAASLDPIHSRSDDQVGSVESRVASGG